jgi:hypothetical protein
LAAGGLWDQWNMAQQAPDRLREWIDQLCAVVDESMRID